MTKPFTPRRTNADYRWTKPKLLAFLQALARGGSVAQAARGVGMSRQSAYRLRVRLGADFAAVWDDGVALARVMRRAQGDAHLAKVTDWGAR
jgi:molybdenum-dependent DNA-binding transcriptional regulator ModE